MLTQRVDPRARRFEGCWVATAWQPAWGLWGWCCLSGTVAAVYMGESGSPFPSPPRSQSPLRLPSPAPPSAPASPPIFCACCAPLVLGACFAPPLPLAPLQSWHSLYKARNDECSTQAQPITKSLKDVTDRLAEATRSRTKGKEGAAGKKVSCFGVRLL